MTPCLGTTKSGKPCRLHGKDKGYCRFHSQTGVNGSSSSGSTEIEARTQEPSNPSLQIHIGSQNGTPIYDEDILLFYGRKNTREGNKEADDKRCYFIEQFQNPGLQFREEYRESWNDFQTKMRTFLHSVRPEYETVRVIYLGGRNYSVDFLFCFDEHIYYGYEFKFNSRDIFHLPQFYQKTTDSQRFPILDADFARDFYEEVVAPRWGDSISQSDYLRNVYSASSTHPVFQTIRDLPGPKRRAYEAIVKEFIGRWLERNAVSGFHLDALTSVFQSKQSTDSCSALVNREGTNGQIMNHYKRYLYWQRNQFRTDEDIFHRDEDFQCVRVVEIRNRNTIVVQSESGYYFHLLLRWKNGIGRLNPAWQISVRAVL